MSSSDKHQNSLPQYLLKTVNDLFEELYDSDLLDSINFQDFCDIKSIEKFDTIQSDPLLQFKNTK